MIRNIELQNTFSGPLDLLLYLVRRDEIDIHDIPVGHVTKEYLVELNKMEEIDVDAGGEFLAMASMLTEIKGRMLLPDIKADDDDDDEIYDPRQGLVEALLEYKKFKEVAAELEDMSAEFEERYSRNVKIPEFQAVVKEKAEELGALDLLAAFQRIARKMLNERAPREIVSEEVPTEVRIQQIEEVVKIRGRASFTSILSDSPTESEMVGFFIAMLELVRMRKISAQQSVDFSEIYFVAMENDGKETEEQNVGGDICEIDDTSSITINRVACLSLSSIFGGNKKVSRHIGRVRSVTANRFDMFGVSKSIDSSSEKFDMIRSGIVFPPLLHLNSNVVFGTICNEKCSDDTVEHDDLEMNEVCVVENTTDNEAVLIKYREGLCLSNPLGLSRSNYICIENDDIDYIGNKFDVLSLNRGIKSNKETPTDTCKDMVGFMRLGVGKVYVYKQEDLNIEGSCVGNVGPAQAIDDLQEECLQDSCKQRKRTQMRLGDIFKIGGGECNTQRNVVKKSLDFLAPNKCDIVRKSVRRSSFLGL